MRLGGLLRREGRRWSLELVGRGGVGGTEHRGDQRSEVEVPLVSRPDDAGEDLLGVGSVAGAVAATDLAGHDGGSDGLFGAPVGRVDGRVPEEGEHGRELGVEMRGEALGVVEGRRRVDEATEAGEQATADRGQTVVGQLPLVATVAQGEPGLQHGFELKGPGAVGMVVSKVLAAPEQVRQTRLVQRVVEAPIGRPPVADEHAVEVSLQDGEGVVETAGVRLFFVDGFLAYS